MIVKNGMVFDEDLTFRKKDLYIARGRIVADEKDLSDRSTVIDAEGLYVLPGLVDVHSHGAVGCDFSDGEPEGLYRILEYEYAHGITTYCPTSMALSTERLLQAMGSVRKLGELCRQKAEGRTDAFRMENVPEKIASIGGIHMEGPFLDPDRRGAHREEYLCRADVELVKECDAACGGLLRLITVAPNVEGVPDLIRAVAPGGTQRDGIHISLGHTAADYELCKTAFAAGADHVTHLFNAMEPFHHREPGLIGAAADCPDCMVELIADGVHVHDSAVRAAFRLFADRVILVSDSMRAAGLEDGEYELGGQQVTVSGNRAVLSDGTIAGSVTNLFDCMRRAIAAGIPRETAIAAATASPAKSIGIYDRVGSLTPGKFADVLLVDEEFRLVRVI